MLQEFNIHSTTVHKFSLYMVRDFSAPSTGEEAGRSFEIVLAQSSANGFDLTKLEA